MAFKFPFTNYHELNLTWILDQLKSLFEQSAENVTTIETYENRLTAVETELPSVSETASEASRAAAAAGSLAQTATQKADTAQENAIEAQGQAGTARREAEAAQTAANEATQAAQQAQATAQNFDGRITQAENDASQALEASRSFENRVQSAITTANNANQTATNAQGIAMRADQNAGAALDKIGDLSQLTTTAKNNLVVAINEAAQSGGAGAVTSVNGQTGAVVLDAGDIEYNDTTVESALTSAETALNGKQNAPAVSGVAGQVLGLNSSLQPVWLDQTGGGGGSGETWHEANLTEADYDSALKMILFDAGNGNSIKDIIVTGAISNDGTNTSNETIYFGFGNTVDRYNYSCPVSTQSIAASQRSIHFICYLKYVMTPPRGSLSLYTSFPLAFFYGVGGSITSINVDQPLDNTGNLRSTNFYTTGFSNPRYFKIELPHWVPSWASIKILYTLN